MNNIRFYQRPPPAGLKKVMNRNHSAGTVTTSPLKAADIPKLAQSNEGGLSDDTVRIDSSDDAPDRRSPCLLDLERPTEEDSVDNFSRTEIGFDDADSADHHLPAAIKSCTSIPTRASVSQPHAFNGLSSTSRSVNDHTSGQNDDNDDDDNDNENVQCRSEIGSGSPDRCDLVEVAQTVVSSDQSVLEIPETQVEASIEEVETPVVECNPSQEWMSLNGRNAQSDNPSGFARRWSFPGSVAPSASCGYETNCRKQRIQNGRSAGGSPRRPYKQVAHQGSSSYATREIGCSQEEGQKGHLDTTVQTFDTKLITEVSSSPFNSASGEIEGRSCVQPVFPEAVRHSTTPKRIVLEDTMPATAPISSLVSLHPLSPDDTMVLTAVVRDATQLTKLSNSLTAWNLPPSLSSESFAVMSIKPLGDQTWLVMAKISSDTIGDTGCANPGRNYPQQQRSPLKRRRRHSVIESDFESDNEGVGPAEHQSHKHRRKHARQEFPVSDESHSDTNDDGNSGHRQPKIKRGRWTQDEDLRLTRMVEVGSPWSTILASFPRRREPTVWSRWNGVLKRLAS
nr:hypothetical protein LTR18_009727 [Exophiala xenobiotica]